MFIAGANYSKLKTNLRLVVSRLKLLEKKKTELAQKARREIADYIGNGKLERARIRVEHIIREDYLVEAMELIEMYCDLLLARFGMIQQMKTLDEGLSEAISSIIWVTPRMQADVAELKIVSDQLTMKYGKPYAQAARENTLQSVNEKLVLKLSVQAPPRILVERYLIEIAKSHNVPYTPDPDVMREDEMFAADMMNSDRTLINFDDNDKPNFPNVPGGPPGGCSGGAGGGGMGQPFISQPMPMVQPFHYPTPTQPPCKPPRGCDSVPPPLPMMPPSGPYPGSASAPAPYSLPPAYDNAMAPPYSEISNNNSSAVNFYPNLESSMNNLKEKPGLLNPMDTLPELPNVPSTTLSGLDGPGSKSEDVDFDELTKRFEQLKKKK